MNSFGIKNEDNSGNEWRLLAAGIASNNSSQIWTVKDKADLGTAIRLTSLSGVVDLIILRKGGSIENKGKLL